MNPQHVCRWSRKEWDLLQWLGHNEDTKNKDTFIPKTPEYIHIYDADVAKRSCVKITPENLAVVCRMHSETQAQVCLFTLGLLTQHVWIPDSLSLVIKPFCVPPKGLTGCTRLRARAVRTFG